MSQKAIILIIILLILLGLSGYLLYKKFLVEEPFPSLGIAKPLETEFELKIFTDQRFLNLKQQVELPIKVDSKGKINPFMKF